MELEGEYDDSNVFAKILRGEIPSAKVWEDDRAVVIMDAFPQAPGHCLVVPKVPARNLMDAPPEMLAHLVAVTQTTAKACARALSCDGIRIMQFNGSAAGQTVFHLHFHVIPIQAGKALDKHAAGQADPGELAELAGKIGAEMA